MDRPQKELLMDEAAVHAALRRMADELQQRVPATETLALVGIQRRGVQLAELLAEALVEAGHARPPVGSLDITLYRDDLMAIGPRPVVGETRLPGGGIDGRTVVIVDDVVYTGRTARAAMDELADFGRPARIVLCVLVDRGGRELPVQPDVAGRVLDAGPDRIVEVRVPDVDGRLAVELAPRPGAGS